MRALKETAATKQQRNCNSSQEMCFIIPEFSKLQELMPNRKRSKADVDMTNDLIIRLAKLKKDSEDPEKIRLLEKSIKSAMRTLAKARNPKVNKKSTTTAKTR